MPPGAVRHDGRQQPTSAKGRAAAVRTGAVQCSLVGARGLGPAEPTSSARAPSIRSAMGRDAVRTSSGPVTSPGPDGANLTMSEISREASAGRSAPGCGRRVSCSRSTRGRSRPHPRRSGAFRSDPMTTGKMVTCMRSTRPAAMSARFIDRLPCERRGTLDSSLSRATSSTASPRTRVTSSQSRGPSSVAETTVVGRALIASLTGSTSFKNPACGPMDCMNIRMVFAPRTRRCGSR